MLVSFTFENWKSYRTATTLSMIADRSRQHNGTLSSSEYYRGLRILPIAAVYGGNAAGKSNLFDALRLYKSLWLLEGRIMQTFLLNRLHGQIGPICLPDSALGFWFRRLVKMNSALHELSRKN